MKEIPTGTGDTNEKNVIPQDAIEGVDENQNQIESVELPDTSGETGEIKPEKLEVAFSKIESAINENNIGNLKGHLYTAEKGLGELEAQDSNNLFVELIEEAGGVLREINEAVNNKNTEELQNLFKDKLKNTKNIFGIASELLKNRVDYE